MTPAKPNKSIKQTSVRKSHFIKISDDLDNCKRAYNSYKQKFPDQKVGNLLALFEALKLLELQFEITSSSKHLWVFEAAKEVIEDRIKSGKSLGKGKGKNERHRYIRLFINYKCYLAVLEASDKGLKGDKKFDYASKILQGTPAQNSPTAVKNAYYSTRKILKNPEERDILMNFPYALKSLAGILSPEKTQL